MSALVAFSVVALVSYLLGSLVAAYYLVRMRAGRDIRGMGSGNAGARNVGRVLGAPGFAITLTLDAAKGALAALFAGALLHSPWAGGVALFAVVVGHIWPVQLGFRGGKGVAPAIGAVLVLDPILCALAVACFVLVLAVVRRFTPAGLVAIAAATPIAVVLARPREVVIPLAITAGLILLAHLAPIAPPHPTAPERVV